MSILQHHLTRALQHTLSAEEIVSSTRPRDTECECCGRAWSHNRDDTQALKALEAVRNRLEKYLGLLERGDWQDRETGARTVIGSQPQ